MKFYRKNLNSNFIRLARIQIDSNVKKENTYFNHYYKFTCHLDNIYNPDATGYLNDLKLEVYCNKSTQYYFTNSRAFYCKLATSDNETYLDIGMNINSYSTNIMCDLECSNDGGVTFYGASESDTGYTRIDYLANNEYMCFKGGKNYLYRTTGSYTLTLPKNVTLIKDVTNDIESAIYDTGILNDDNDSWTLSEVSTTDYTKVINMTVKRNIATIIDN